MGNLIGSPEINKVLRKRLCPLLRESGFDKVTARKSWKWQDASIWVLHIRAVGGNFSDVTGWPSASVGVWMGVFFREQPSESPRAIKQDEKGRLLPEEYTCRARSHLECTFNQTQLTQNLKNPAERIRTDIWWISPDGSNVDAVVTNIGEQFMAQGLSWFHQQKP